MSICVCYENCQEVMQSVVIERVTKCLKSPCCTVICGKGLYRRSGVRMVLLPAVGSATSRVGHKLQGTYHSLDIVVSKCHTNVVGHTNTKLDWHQCDSKCLPEDTWVSERKRHPLLKER